MKTVVAEVSNKAPAFQLSVDAQYLYNHFRKMKVGDVLTYEQMNKMLGKDVQKEHRKIIYAAMGAVRKEGVEVHTVPKVGVKRLTNSEIVDSAQAVYARTRRMVRRGVKVLANANFDDLPDEYKTKHNMNTTLYGVFSTITNPKNIDKLQKRIAETKMILPISRTLELFQ